MKKKIFKFFMKYIPVICFYAAAFINYIKSGQSDVTFFCLGSTMLCLSCTEKNNTNSHTHKTCPKCGNTNLQATPEANSKNKGFSAIKGFCGTLLFGPIGFLCGVCKKDR